MTPSWEMKIGLVNIEQISFFLHHNHMVLIYSHISIINHMVCKTKSSRSDISIITTWHAKPGHDIITPLA